MRYVVWIAVATFVAVLVFPAIRTQWRKLREEYNAGIAPTEKPKEPPSE